MKIILVILIALVLIGCTDHPVAPAAPQIPVDTCGCPRKHHCIDGVAIPDSVDRRGR